MRWLEIYIFNSKFDKFVYHGIDVWWDRVDIWCIEVIKSFLGSLQLQLTCVKGAKSIDVKDNYIRSFGAQSVDDRTL